MSSQVYIILTKMDRQVDVMELQADEEGKFNGKAGRERSERRGVRPPCVTNSLI